MIPNVFVSSTVQDLGYLRDAVRDAIENDLLYHPVMSEYGDVGYIHAGTAAEACYVSVADCHLAIIIVGCRYGEVSQGGFSVTHREFLTAQEHKVPLIALVEQKVLHYKEAYDANPPDERQKRFPNMDNPGMTFRLIEEIEKASSYNGIIPFTNAADAKKLLKKQIADFVGRHLSDTIRPIRTDVQEVLVEVKALRTLISPSDRSQAVSEAETTKFIRTMRFLLDDAHAEYREVAEQLCGDIDVAVPMLMKAESFEDFVEKCGGKILIEDDLKKFRESAQWKPGVPPQQQFLYSSHSASGYYAISGQKTVMLSTSRASTFREVHAKLAARLKAP